MKKLAVIEAFGVRATPWSVPDIGNVTTRTGKRIRFARRRKKSDIDRGSVSLEHWQQFVCRAAREAWPNEDFYTGPVLIEFEFYTRTPEGKQHGQLWEVPVKLNKKGEWGKTQPFGMPEPDLVNMIKGTEDAIAGVIFPNDVQTRMVSAVTLYGRAPGVRVTVYAIEPEDFPGAGEPLEI
jgi:Holliday junction resolvase RusA-like endonuclease